MGYINISWIKYVHSEGKNRFCVVCYDYESKPSLEENENFKYAHFTAPNDNSFNDHEDGANLSMSYIENLNYMSEKFKENTFLNYQHKFLNQ